MYKSLNYTTAISRLTRSGYVNLRQNVASQNLYGFTWNATGFAYTQNNNTPTAVVWSGNTDITNTFDAYRIMAVKFYIQFNQDTSNVTTVAQTLPYIIVSKDYDDANTSSGSPNELLQRPDVTNIVLGRPNGTLYDYNTTLVPKLATNAYATTVASGYVEPKARQWVSTATGLTAAFVDPNHYGIKFFIDCSLMTGSAGSQIGDVRVFSKVYFECKHPK